MPEAPSSRDPRRQSRRVLVRSTIDGTRPLKSRASVPRSLGVRSTRADRRADHSPAGRAAAAASSRSSRSARTSEPWNSSSAVHQPTLYSSRAFSRLDHPLAPLLRRASTGTTGKLRRANGLHVTTDEGTVSMAPLVGRQPARLSSSLRGKIARCRTRSTGANGGTKLARNERRVRGQRRLDQPGERHRHLDTGPRAGLGVNRHVATKDAGALAHAE